MKFFPRDLCLRQTALFCFCIELFIGIAHFGYIIMTEILVSGACRFVDQ